MGPGFFWFGGMWIFPVIGIIIMLFVLYTVFGRGGYWGLRSEPPRYSGENAAIEILKTRYAKGEITKEEYEMMRKTLLT